MSKIRIVGNLTAKPVMKTTADGRQVCTFSIAENETVKGNRVTTFFNCGAFGNAGDIISKYMDKGRKMLVEGPETVTTYTGSDGQLKISRNVTVNEFLFLDSGNSNNAQEAPAQPRPQVVPQAAAPVSAPIDDGLPF